MQDSACHTRAHCPSSVNFRRWGICTTSEGLLVTVGFHLRPQILSRRCCSRPLPGAGAGLEAWLLRVESGRGQQELGRYPGTACPGPGGTDCTPTTCDWKGMLLKYRELGPHRSQHHTGPSGGLRYKVPVLLRRGRKDQNSWRHQCRPGRGVARRR